MASISLSAILAIPNQLTIVQTSADPAGNPIFILYL